MTHSSTEFGFFLELEPGDEVVRCLIQFAREQEVDAAVVTGVGSLTDLELGTGESHDREQHRSRVPEPLEVCSLTGTVTLVDGEPFPHLHGSFARADCSVVGGHVYMAVCGARLDVALQLLRVGRGSEDGAGSDDVARNRHSIRD